MDRNRPVLRPMGIGDLLDSSFALYRQNFALFAGIVAVLQVPLAILTAFISSGNARPVAVTNPDGTQSVDGGAFANYLLVTGGITLLQAVFTIFIAGALALAVSTRYLGRETSVGETYSAIGLKTFLVLLLATLLWALSIILGFFLLIVGAIYFYVRFQFVSQVVILERAGARAAFGRSSRLVRGSWWRVFGITLVVAIMVAILSGISSAVAVAVLRTGSSATNRAIGSGIGALASILVQPIQLATITLLYYDLRIRKEGFDLEQMALTLDAAPAGRGSTWPASVE